MGLRWVIIKIIAKTEWKIELYKRFKSIRCNNTIAIIVSLLIMTWFFSCFTLRKHYNTIELTSFINFIFYETFNANICFGGKRYTNLFPRYFSMIKCHHICFLNNSSTNKVLKKNIKKTIETNNSNNNEYRRNTIDSFVLMYFSFWWKERVIFTRVKKE